VTGKHQKPNLQEGGDGSKPFGNISSNNYMHLVLEVKRSPHIWNLWDVRALLFTERIPVALLKSEGDGINIGC